MRETGKKERKNSKKRAGKRGNNNLPNNFFECLHVASLILKDCNYGNGGGGAGGDNGGLKSTREK